MNKNRSRTLTRDDLDVLELRETEEELYGFRNNRGPALLKILEVDDRWRAMHEQAEEIERKYHEGKV